MKSAASLVQLDWTPRNIIGIQRALRAAYNETASVCDPNRHAFFNTPNRPYGLGYNRWLAVDYHIKQACEIGWINGIAAKWVPLGGKGGLCALELRGSYTSAVAVHLQQPEETPRDSDYRYDKRLSNERYPLLAGFEQFGEPDQLLNLILVHGDKDAEFAELRAYDNPDNRASYTSFTGNIMAGMPLTNYDDSEIVPEPNVALLKQVTEQKNPSIRA